MSVPQPIRDSLFQLLSEVRHATGIPRLSILGRARSQPTSDARAVFAAAATRIATRDQIAQFLRRDRKTIDHLIRTTQSPQHPHSEILQALLQDQHTPVHQIHPHLRQPDHPMNVRRPDPTHRIDLTHIADTCREIQALLDRFQNDPRTTEYEALAVLRETGIHANSLYVELRTRRRLAGFEADPYNQSSGLESWISMAEACADPPKPQTTHPPRNPRPATHAAA